jgi:hypothetical protein
VDRRDGNGDTPLHIAAGHGLGFDAGSESPNGSQTDDPGGSCVRLLLKAGAEVNARDKVSKETPLHIAFGLMWHYQNKAIVKALIDAGASLNLKNDDGQTPLHKAAIESNLEVLRVVFSPSETRAISINARDAEGKTPLHHLIESMEIWINGMTQNSMNHKKQDCDQKLRSITSYRFVPRRWCQSNNQRQEWKDTIGLLSVAEEQKKAAHVARREDDATTFCKQISGGPSE